MPPAAVFAAACFLAGSSAAGAASPERLAGAGCSAGAFALGVDLRDHRADRDRVAFLHQISSTPATGAATSCVALSVPSS